MGKQNDNGEKTEIDVLAKLGATPWKPGDTIKIMLSETQLATLNMALQMPRLGASPDATKRK